MPKSDELTPIHPTDIDLYQVPDIPYTPGMSGDDWYRLTEQIARVELWIMAHNPDITNKHKSELLRFFIREARPQKTEQSIDITAKEQLSEAKDMQEEWKRLLAEAPPELLEDERKQRKKS